MASTSGAHRWQFWIDRGGTFTDVVARRPDGTHLGTPGSNIYGVADADKPAVCMAAACCAAKAVLLDRTLKVASVPPAELEPTSWPYFIRLRRRGARLVRVNRGA